MWTQEEYVCICARGCQGTHPFLLILKDFSYYFAEENVLFTFEVLFLNED